MASRTHLRPPTRTQLEERLARTERQLGAAQEWAFATLGRGEAPLVLAKLAGGDMEVLVVSLTRACGGVAVVRFPASGGHTMQPPTYLDDLLASYERDSFAEVREVARKLRALRDAEIDKA